MNVYPLLIHTVSFGLLLKGYMKYVHNRPYEINIDSKTLEALKKNINRNLALFVFLGIPVILICLKHPAIKLKNTFCLQIISPLKNKIPNWIKLIIIFLSISIVVLKLLGIKIFFYVSCFLAINYLLFNWYLLLKFTYNKIRISNVLPEFLINWLKKFELLSSNEENIKILKKICYIKIFIYY